MLDYSQLGALLAVAETGTYEGAARELNVSSFAVKQRIKTLESKLGVKLIESSPTHPSRIGRVLCDHTRQVKDLEDKVIEEHRHVGIEGNREDGDLQALPIAVCEEAFTEWFADVLGDLEKIDPSPTIDVKPAPKTEIVGMMRSGEVMAAISHHTQDIYGFKTYPLGEISYYAVASPDFVAEHFAEGVTGEALAKAKCYRFCGNDDLAYEWVDQMIGKPTKLRIVRHPSSDGSLQACKMGRAWAMHPLYRIKDALASGELVELDPDVMIKRPLFWHVTGTMADTLKPMSFTIRQKAKSLL
jgi:LysR family transcriptional regulator (chromosome initiation inhibitor)